MLLSRNLRFRITAGILVMVVVITAAMAIITFMADEKLEEEVLDQTLRRETEQVKQMAEHFPSISPANTATQRFYLIPPDDRNDLPPELAALPHGLHHSVVVGERSYHVSHDKMDGRDLYITYDITDIENRELRLRYLLMMLIAGGVLIAVSAGYFLSRLTISPVTEFARRVSNLDPNKRQVSLSRDFRGYEIGMIAEAFDRYLARLDRFIERERDFTEGASHELRTPLTIISGAVEILLKNPRLDEEWRAPLQRIQRASDRMTMLIQSLLFMARDPGTGNASGEAAACDVDEVLSEVLASHQHLLEGAGVRCVNSVRESFVIAAPATALEIVAGNIIGNAIAHVPGGELRIVAENRRLEFSDNGPGIEPENLDRIFRRRFRGRESSGSGLGLYIVSEICNRYGWRINVTSRPGEGTTFTLTFPP